MNISTIIIKGAGSLVLIMLLINIWKTSAYTVSESLSAKNAHPRPVLLVHGFCDTGAIFNKMKKVLNGKGYDVHTINLTPNNGSMPLEQLALQIDKYAKTNFPNKKFDIIGFSMGGIVSRYYLQRLSGLSKVKNFITISAPHNGTLTAFFRFNKGIRQLRPNSKFLNDLNKDSSSLKQVNFTSIRTPFDLMIVPSSSSYMDVAENKKFPILLHSWSLKNKKVINFIDNKLKIK